MKQISIIVAIAENNAIGKDNQLLWHIPEDLKRFKKITTGHTIVMGRKTYESMPIQPLPNRRSVVISHNPGLFLPGAEITDSVDGAIELMEEVRENFVIGGGVIYKEFLPLVQKLYLTIVHKHFDADTFFPEIDFAEWKEVSRKRIEASGSLGFDYSYVNLERL